MDIPEQQRRRYLRACRLFDGLDEGVLARVAARAQGVLLPRGAVLFHQGDPSNGLYVLCSGLVSVSVTDEDGNTLTLSVPERGTPLGEMTLVGSDPRSATITALEESSLLHLGSETILALLAEEPVLAAHLILFLSQRLRQSNTALQTFAFGTLQERLLRKLVELGLQHGSLRQETLVLGRKFSQTALAEMLGVTREAVNKQLKSLQGQGSISLEKGIVHIHRPADIVRNHPET
jgi:CRP-like cAMP-binding protein